MIEIDKNILKIKDQVVSHRRWFHNNPEIGFEVENTRDYILGFLKKFGFTEVNLFAKTGIRAVFKGKKGERTLAFRADMDALPIEEKTGLKFASRKHGYMHACGHDGHMAILLGLAEWISNNQDFIDDNIVLIFQPDEENEGGALPMIKEGALEDPKIDVIFGIHIMPEISQGLLGIKSGPLMAQTNEVDIELMGKSAHGAIPHTGIDTIIVAANFISSLQSIITRKLNPMENATISIGMIEGGSSRNILADKVKMKCTIRSFSEEVYEEIKLNITNLLDGLKKSYGIDWDYNEITYYPPVINHDGWVKKLLNVLSEDSCLEAKPMMIAEDFSFYQKYIPGVFIFLGSRSEEKGFTHSLHSNFFDFQEDILLQGIQLYKNIICKI